MRDCDVEIQTLENTVQAQAELIERIMAKGPLGFFQRLRLGRRYKDLPRRLREDELRNANIRLKAQIKELTGGHGKPQ